MAIVERPLRPRGITVIASKHACTCVSCGGTGDVLLKGKAGPVCLDCAHLGHLEFLPSGDATLSRRARKASRSCAVVVHWNIRRNRYERQGILAEPAAIEQAARECLADADHGRRAEEDVRFRREFAEAIGKQFPGCPADRAEAIALHTAARRIGRALDADAVRRAVVASVRHVDTNYDDLLMEGVDRESAREQAQKRVNDVVNAWRDGAAMLDE
jgi:hypothetical protein